MVIMIRLRIIDDDGGDIDHDHGNVYDKYDNDNDNQKTHMII